MTGQLNFLQFPPHYQTARTHARPNRNDFPVELPPNLRFVSGAWGSHVLGSPCLLGRLRNRDGWSSIWGRLFQTKLVMGWLWDDQFRHLGHPPKFYRVQGAIFIENSSSWWHISLILMKYHWRITKYNVCSPKQPKKKQKKEGMHHTEVRSGDAPKHPFWIKTNKHLQKT